jgi:hypothetical protein
MKINIYHIETHVIPLQSDKRGPINRRRKYQRLQSIPIWMRMTTLAVKRRQQTAHKNS